MAKKGAEHNALLQPGLGGSFTDLVVSLSAEQLKHRDEARKAILFRPWRKAATGRFLMVNVNDNDGVELTLSNFKVLDQGHNWKEGDKRLAGLILVTDGLDSEEQRQKVIDFGRQAAARFQKYGAHLEILWPKNGKDLSDKEGKMDLARKLGGVEVKILTQTHSDYNLVEARMPFARSRRQPSNLLDNPRYIGWYRKLFKTMRQKYAAMGLKVVDSAAIVDALKSTTNPPKTIESLEAGFGVKVEALCGCEWQVDIEGNPLRTIDCHSGDCDFGEEQGLESFSSLVNSKPESEKRTYLLGESPHEGYPCWGCGQEMTKNIWTEGEPSPGKVNLVIEIKCGSCGTDSERHKTVDSDQIIETPKPHPALEFARQHGA